MHLPPRNRTLAPRELHLELMDPRSFDVWLCQSPVTAAQVKAFKPEAPYLKSGAAHAAMDAAWFLRSPGAACEGELESRSIGGLEFVRVARPLGFKGLAPGASPTRVEVDKHHVLRFAAGRALMFAKIGDNWFVQQTVRSDGEAFAPPADWMMRLVLLNRDWEVRLPAPATVWFFRNLDSFAGPVAFPEHLTAGD